MLTRVAYLRRSSKFFGLDFFVDERVLVPRFETEVLVGEVIERVAELRVKQGKEPPRLLDMCTGSGAVAISLAKNIEGAKIDAVDVSIQALEVARINIEQFGVEVKLIQSDMFKNVSGRYDIIVSNPPYVRTEDIGAEDRGTLLEPRIALDGKTDGLGFYRLLARESGRFLKPSGILALEIGFDQAEDVKTLLNLENFSNIEVLKDQRGKDRVVIARWNGEY